MRAEYKGLLALLILGIGAKQMQGNQNKYYGVLGGDLEIKMKIYLVCSVISVNTLKEASQLLSLTVAVESDNGNAKDYSPNYGEGLTQFDKIGFNEVKRVFSQSKYNYLMQKINNYLLIDVLNANYEDLRKSPMLSLVFARLLYYSKSGAIPKDFEGQWNYYKKHFNSYGGATTYNKFLEASKKSLIS